MKAPDPTSPAPRSGKTGASSPITEKTAPPRRSLSRQTWLTVALGIVALVGGTSVCVNAWHETQLREAYLPDLRTMARQHPFDSRLLVVLAGRQAEARQYAEAAETFQQAVSTGENSPQIWLAWSASKAAAGDREMAGATLLLGMRQPALDAPLRAALDRWRSLPPNAPPGVVAQTICPQTPWDLIAPYTRGSFLNGLVSWYGRRYPAQSGFATRENWAKEQTHNAQAQQLWAEALLRNECYAQAEAAARHALTLSPDSLSAHLTLADALYHQGETGKAGLEYASLTKAHPNSLQALLGLGQVALDKKLILMSVEVYSKAVKLAPKSVDAWVGLGKACYHQGVDFNRTLSAFETAIKLAPSRTDFYPAYADVLRAQARFAEAETLLRKRLAIAPNEASTYYYLAVTLLAYNVTSARQAEAEADLRQSLKLQPQGVSVVARLGRLLADEKRCVEAIPYLEAAIKTDPHSLPVAMALARCYRGAGRMKEAQVAEANMAALAHYSTEVKQLEEELQLQPLNAKLYLKTAQLYADGGEMEKARNYQDAAMMILNHGKRAATGILKLRGAISQDTLAPEKPQETH